MLHYGLYNCDQLQFLQEKGFTVYKDIYTVRATTLSSMSRMFAVDPHPRGQLRAYTAGNGPVQNVLKNHGFTTIGVFFSDYQFRGTDSVYQISYPSQSPAYRKLIKSVLEGEFRYDPEYEGGDYNEYLKYKRRIFNEQSHSPVFMYTHNRYPGHSQMSGKCRPDETERYVQKVHVGRRGLQADQPVRQGRV